MPIRNIIFDWSGVISDDFFAVYRATMEIFKKLDIKEISFEKFRTEFCLPYMDFYRKKTSDVNKLMINQIFLEMYGKKIKAKPYRNVKDVLTELKSKGIRMAIVTSQLEPFIKEEITSFGLKGIFTHIYTNVDNKVDEIENVLSKTGFGKDETAFVGDMPHDVAAARKAGLKMIASAYGYVDRKTIEKEKPDFIIDSIEELPSILK